MEEPASKKQKTHYVVTKKAEQTYENVLLKTGFYKDISKADELHKKFCPCALHYSVWYKYFNKNWKNKVATSAFSKNWCDACQSYIDASTAWNKHKRTFSAKQQQTTAFQKLQQEWEEKEANWLRHISQAQAERKAHECLRELAKAGKIRLICFDFKTTLVLPYWGYHCSPRAVYYMSRMNVYLFGVVDESSNSFAGYVYPENFVDSKDKPTKKGSSHVIAMLYHHLEQNGLTDPERTFDRDLYFAADNCSGQNKNQYVLQFLCLAIELGWADNIYFDFMVAGHTKFGPDRWFGMIGKHIIGLDAWNMYDLVSNISGAFKHQHTVKDLTNENCVNFKPFLQKNYKKPDFAVSEHYHFWFSKDHKGCVRIKSSCEQSEWSQTFQLRKTKGDLNFNVSELPKFCLIPLSKDRVKTMRECKQLVPNQRLDFEDKWNAWDPPLYDIQQIVDVCIQNGNKEYKVKFKDTAVENISNDKYDEWFADEQLVGAQDLLKKFKGQVKLCNTVQKIHDKQGDKLLVQWNGWPKKQDWTWEEESLIQQLQGRY